jgi:hypothetical protein
MKKTALILISLFAVTALFSRPVLKPSNINEISRPAKLVAQIYKIYKNQKYKSGLSITTGSMLKRFKKLHNHMVMNNNKIPATLKRLSTMMYGFKLLNEYTQNYNGKKYVMVNCLWIMKYRDTTPQSEGIAKTKWVVRAYLAKKVGRSWKISSEKFITEYLMRGEERALLEKIEKKIRTQQRRAAERTYINRQRRS